MIIHPNGMAMWGGGGGGGVDQAAWAPPSPGSIFTNSYYHRAYGKHAKPTTL